MSISCSDYYAKLDGTQNGQYGSVSKVPAYEEDSSGTPIRYNTITDCVRIIITQLGNVKKYNIDDIGAYMGMVQYNPNWKAYRNEHPEWNYLPYDEEFSRGDTIATMIDKPINLYPNWDYFFDEDGVFVVKMIPSSYEDSVVLTYDYIKQILVADSTESSSVVPTSVRNVCEVWGQVIDTDYYSETVTTSSSTYNVVCSSYDAYCIGDKLAIKVSSTNTANPYIKVNNLSSIPIYCEDTDKPLSAGTLKSGGIYSFRYRKSYSNGTYKERFYYLGQWEVHALNVLTDGTVIENGYTDQDGNVLGKYSKAYFQAKYNCQNVALEVIPDSPFTVQQIGERVDIKSGNEYEHIDSDSLAQIQAQYGNWQNCRLTDTISITTKMIPWLKEYQKIEYKRANSTELCQYVTQRISHDPFSGTTAIDAYRFYPLYQPTE